VRRWRVKCSARLNDREQKRHVCVSLCMWFQGLEFGVAECWRCGIGVHAGSRAPRFSSEPSLTRLASRFCYRQPISGYTIRTMYSNSYSNYIAERSLPRSGPAPHYRRGDSCSISRPDITDFPIGLYRKDDNLRLVFAVIAVLIGDLHSEAVPVLYRHTGLTV
jgi:hypothetical protein